MTVASTTRKQTFAGAQSALTFSFRTLVNYPQYIQVKNTLISSGVETDLTYGVDYTVALQADGSGGVVTISPTFSALYTHTVYRDTDDTQVSDYDDFNQFPANTIENDLDRRTLISQEKSEEVARTAKLPISSSITDVLLPSPVDGDVLMWSGTGGTLVNGVLSDFDLAAKASNAEAMAGIEDTHYMTPLKTATAISSLTPTHGNTVVSSTNGYISVSNPTTAVLSLNVGTGGSQVLAHDSGGDIYDRTFTDYSASSTIVGWTSFTTKVIYTKKIGKLVYVWFNLAGTSNSTATSFTLPDTNGAIRVIVVPNVQDNTGTAVAGFCDLAAGAATVTLGPTVNTVTWTASGTKSCVGQFCYQAA